MIGSILCRLGLHRWHYLLSEVGYIPLDGWPVGTTCERCGEAHPAPIVPPTERPGGDSQ